LSQSATRRSLDILELLSEAPEGLALSDICARLRIPKSVAHRLLALLADSGFVRQDAAARYGLTLKLTLLGLRHYASTGLKDLIQPLLDRLAVATGELVRVAIVEGDGMVWVAKAQGARFGLKYDPDTGYDVVLHATATGKAWLSTLPEDEAVRIVSRTGFKTPERFGPNAIRTIKEFRRALAETRARGYGVAIEEGEPGTAAVAVAVRVGSGRRAATVATLSAAGPMSRFTTAQRTTLARHLKSAADELAAIWPIRQPLAARADLEGESIQHVV
jgi:IclR family transcriptional regulator, acetate operon repressor